MIRILLAEHDERAADFLSNRLRRHGHEVLIALDGEAAVKTARSGRPHVLLLSMDIPVLDAHSVANAIRSDLLIQSTPIIALAPFSDAGERERALLAGCTECHPEPIDFLRLLERIEHHAGRPDKDMTGSEIEVAAPGA
jgi:two-component system, cell cycle response regulator DivK